VHLSHSIRSNFINHGLQVAAVAESKLSKSSSIGAENAHHQPFNDTNLTTAHLSKREPRSPAPDPVSCFRARVMSPRSSATEPQVAPRQPLHCVGAPQVPTAHRRACSGPWILRSQEYAPRSGASRAARLFQRHTTCQCVSCQWLPLLPTTYFSSTEMGSKWGASRSRQPHTSSTCGRISLASSPLFSLIQASP
jgi:hypothetical protein